MGKREIKFQTVYQHPKGEVLISRSYDIQELSESFGFEIFEETCNCDCQPIGETNVVECQCEDYYYEFKEVCKRQYTGLKDKNGKEIYEGDIVKWDAGSHWNNCGGETKEARTEKVYYEGFGFEPFIHSLGYSDVTMIDYSDCEIIGNIYEHPELLTK